MTAARPVQGPSPGQVPPDQEARARPQARLASVPVAPPPGPHAARSRGQALACPLFLPPGAVEAPVSTGGRRPSRTARCAAPFTPEGRPRNLRGTPGTQRRRSRHLFPSPPRSRKLDDPLDTMNKEESFCTAATPACIAARAVLNRGICAGLPRAETGVLDRAPSENLHRARYTDVPERAWPPICKIPVADPASDRARSRYGSARVMFCTPVYNSNEGLGSHELVATSLGIVRLPGRDRSAAFHRPSGHR